LHPLIFLPALIWLLIALALLIASTQATDDRINIALIAAAVLFGVLALASWARAAIRRATTELAITDRRVIYKSGLLSRHTLEMNRSKVESVDVDQSILGRVMGEDSPGLPALVVAYLALVREARPAGSADAMWQGCYRYFPWEDWREGKPESLARIEDRLSGWAQDAASEPERRLRQERLGLAFGLPAGSWNEELVLERYELL